MSRTFFFATPLALLVATSLLVPPAAAQTVPRGEKPPALFTQVIPQPTGQNGYEELVYACGLLKNLRLWNEFESRPGDQTLEEKRVLLADRTIQRVLALVRTGLSKPVSSPRTSLDFTTMLPELTQFRSLSRLLVVQQYVQFADGRVSDALATTRTGMLLGRVVKTDTMIAGLVGISITAVAVRPLADHLDQLSAKECQALYQLCENWLQAPSALPHMLAAERAGHKGMLRSLRVKGAEALVGQLNADDKDAPPEVKRAVAQFRQEVGNDPQAMERLLNDLETRMDQYFRKLDEEVKKPLWERKWPEADADGTLAGQMISLIQPSLTAVENATAREEAVVRLLGCHAAVLRFRWEHNRLPKSLDELKLGALATDPYTGQALQYRILNARRYRLGSVGQVADDTDDPRVVNGRRPVTLTPDD